MYRYKIAHFQNIQRTQNVPSKKYLQQLEEQEERRRQLLSRLKTAAMGAAGIGAIAAGVPIALSGKRKAAEIINSTDALYKYSKPELKELQKRILGAAGRQMLGASLISGGAGLLVKTAPRVFGEGSLYDDEYDDEYDN